MRNRWMAAAAGLCVAATAVPAQATVFEIYVRGQGGYEYLDLTAISAEGLLNPDNYDTLPTNEQDLLDAATEEYSGSGWAVGGQAGITLFDFLDIGIDFRQAGLYFDLTEADLTQVEMHAALHFLGSEMIIDPSVLLGLGYCYLTTNIPGIGSGAVVAGEERTANGFIGRAGAALDFRFVSWLSAGIAAEFSFLYFDASAEHSSWGFSTDILGRIAVHI